MKQTKTQRVASSFDRVRAVTRDIDQHIFISLADEANALAQVDESLPLAGLTFAAKDNIDCLGLKTTAACPSWGFQPQKSATVVSRLQAAGATCIGKTNMDQFATGLVGTRSPYGVPLNALDPKLVPGGSSSGSAVAVARGLVDFALGTDTAGSGRVPAAHNGIVGLKPTRGLISTTGVLPAVRSIDCVSIFARTIAEVWKVFEFASGYDATDPFSRKAPEALLTIPIKRVGIPTNLEFDSERDRHAWHNTIEALSGVEIVEIDISPMREAADLLYNGPWVAERYAAVGEFLDTNPPDADIDVSSIIRGGKNHTAVAAYEASYKLANLSRICEELWMSMDLLLVPTVPGLATLAEVEADPIGRNTRLGTYTNWVNLLDQCALTIPTRRLEDDIPYSVTLIGPAGADAVVAATAATFFEQPITAAETAATSDYLDIAVVGAHLKGQPLNWQLTEPGGVFLRTAQTSAAYQLFAIADSMPPKPALVHSENGQTIKLEVWRLPLRAVGQLLAQIPAPLGLGTLTLDSGDTVKGFIAEPRAIDRATDITEFGGWRAFLAKDTGH